MDWALPQQQQQKKVVSPAVFLLNVLQVSWHRILDCVRLMHFVERFFFFFFLLMKRLGLRRGLLDAQSFSFFFSGLPEKTLNPITDRKAHNVSSFPHASTFDVLIKSQIYWFTERERVFVTIFFFFFFLYETRLLWMESEKPGTSLVKVTDPVGDAVIVWWQHTHRARGLIFFFFQLNPTAAES